MCKPSRSQQLEQLIDGSIDSVIGLFDFRRGSMLGIGFVTKQAMGHRAIDAFAEQGKQQGDFLALLRQSVGIAAVVTFQEAVGLEFTQVIAELIERIGFGGKAKSGEDAFPDFCRRPTARRCCSWRNCW